MSRPSTGMDANLPRVLLLVAEPPHLSAAGAIILFRLFRHYPADRLLVISNHRPTALTSPLPCRYEHLPLAADRLSRTRFWRWRAALRSFGASAAVRLGRVDERLGGFKPDVVVTLMQDSWYYDLAARYASARHLPLVLFVHDLAHGFEPVPRWLQRKQRERDERVYRQATARLCVSQPMVEHFGAMFGIASEHLPPPRSDDPPAQPPEGCRNLKTAGRLTLGYAGGLHYGYGEQLLRMLPVLRETGTVVEAFGPLPGGRLTALRESGGDVLRFNGYVSPPEAAWKRVIETCDAVLQPYLNPPGPHELQYRTHFPSKLGDSLSLGLPLLVTGPASASGVAWCLQHPGCAVCVTELGDPALRSAILKLKTAPDLRVALASRAQEFASEFDPQALRRQLLDALLRASKRIPPTGNPVPA